MNLQESIFLKQFDKYSYKVEDLYPSMLSALKFSASTWWTSQKSGKFMLMNGSLIKYQKS